MSVLNFEMGPIIHFSAQAPLVDVSILVAIFSRVRFGWTVRHYKETLQEGKRLRALRLCHFVVTYFRHDHDFVAGQVMLFYCLPKYDFG